MRLATQDTAFIPMRNESGIIEEEVTPDNLAGIRLGIDVGSHEHERDIKGLKRLFGIPEPMLRRNHPLGHLIGVGARTITQVPENLFFRDYGADSFTYLVCVSWLDLTLPPTAARLDSVIDCSGLHAPKGEELVAWDQDSFGIRVRSGVASQLLRRVYDALVAKDAVICALNSRNPFSPACLHILIRSRLPEEFNAAMGEHDLNQLE